MLPTKTRFRTNGHCSLSLTCVSALLLLIIFPAVEPAPTADIDGQLQLGPEATVRRREIAGGVTDVFVIPIDAGKLLRFSIDKGDIVMSTVLHGPPNTKLLEHLSQDFDVVEISFPADVTGMYRIEIGSRERSDTRRHYELRIEPLKNSTVADRKDSEARQAVASAGVLRANWTEGSIREAIKKYDEAALIWTSMSQFASASSARLQAGDLYFHLSEFASAIKQYQTAADLGKRTGDPLAEGRALSHMGRLNSYFGKNDLAKNHLTRALGLLKSNSSPSAKNAYAEALSNLAEVNYAKGNWVKSSEQLEEARKLFENDRQGEAKTRLFAAYQIGSMGAPDKALSEISQALSLYQSVGNRAGEGLALTALGLFYSFNKLERRAIQSHHDAIQIFRSIGNRHGEAVALNGLGEASEKAGEYRIALENYGNALRLFQHNGALDFAAVATFGIARTYLGARNVDQALRHFERCLTLSRKAGNVRIAAYALSELAKINAARGDYEQALKHHRRILAFYESIRDKQGQALELNNYGDLLFLRGQKQQALDIYRKALPLSEEVNDKDILTSTFYNLARAHRDLGDYESARYFIEQSLKIIEDVRPDVGSPDVRASYLSSLRKHYDLGVSILMQLHRNRPGERFDASAFLLSEKSRARSLLDQLGESQADLRRGAPAELLQRERELRALFRAEAQYEMALSDSNANPTEAAEVASQMAHLRSEYQNIQSKLRDQSTHELPRAMFAASGLEEMQNTLRADDTMLLEYSLGDERSYLWAVTANTLQSYELPARKTIEDTAKEVYKLLTARQRFDGKVSSDYAANVEASERLYFEKASHLSHMLLGPVAGQLGTRRLLVVTEGILQYTSFEALPVPVSQSTGAIASTAQPERFLLETNEVDLLPSMSTLVAMRAEASRPASPERVVAVIADPIFNRNDERVETEGLSPNVVHAKSAQSGPESVQPVAEGSQQNRRFARLPHASDEADAISSVAPYGSSIVAKGFEASRETVMNVSDYQIVHFATHGFVNSEHPELSSIVLTMMDRNGEEKNGLMSLNDIYSLDLSAELTVLSACETALGTDIKGEGLVGLTHSFMSAGSRSVVASLWKVDDQATASLMSDFYRSMLQKGMPPVAALRAAKLKMMQEKRWAAPYYWAGFVFQGDYESRITVEKNSHLSVVTSLLFLAFISSGVIVFLRFRHQLFSIRRK